MAEDKVAVELCCCIIRAGIPQATLGSLTGSLENVLSDSVRSSLYCHYLSLKTEFVDFIIAYFSMILLCFTFS